MKTITEQSLSEMTLLNLQY